MNKNPIVFSLFGYDYLASCLNKKLDYENGNIDIHEFPDKEILIKINSDVKGREVVFVGSLDRPNDKLVTLIFSSEVARSLGAKKVTLIAPYLAYMRQDKVFHTGEGVSSRYFGKLISTYFDKLITIDPHLHRMKILNEIYPIPNTVLHVANNISRWINENIKKPLLIGPDVESSQWVNEIAHISNVPFLILEKIRRSDTDVQVSIPEIENYHDATPILVDDIISTGMTMIETVKHLKTFKMTSPICIGVHAVFADDAYQNLIDAGASKIVTCNTIIHPSNGIDISDNIVAAMQE